MSHDIESSEETLQIEHHWDWDQFSPERIEALIAAKDRLDLGYLVWNKLSHDVKNIEAHIKALQQRGISHLRTGISWAEWSTPPGRQWIGTYLMQYAAANLAILPCFSFTPPHLALAPRVNAPPSSGADYSIFLEEVLDEFGHLFDTVELWNEWNLNTDWDPDLDPNYERFVPMIASAARVAKRYRKRVLLGGPSKVNKGTLLSLAAFAQRGLDEVIDVLGFHNLRGTWSDQVSPAPLRTQANLLQQAWGRDVPVWLTEYGFSTGDPLLEYDPAYLERIQVSLFAYTVYSLLSGEIERAYWYTFRDEVHESLRKATTGWEDILQFYYGDTREDGTEKLLGQLLLAGGPTHVLRYAAKEGLLPLIEAASLKRTMPTEPA